MKNNFLIKDLVRKIRYKVNTRYKDRVFCFIFGDAQFRKNALSLYNAVNNTDYTDEKELILYTLSDAVYIKMKNDVAYLFQDTIALYEHQSTINPNMPIRGLMYFSEMYSKFFSENKLNIYGKSLIKIPNPQYIVFYNGEDYYQDNTKLRLSDAFFQTDTSGDFEWTATVVNINNADNPIRQRCSVLNEYMIFVEKVRNHSKHMPFEEAVDLATKECIAEGILSEVLQKYRAEVCKMIITEFDEEVFVKGIRAEGFEEGFEEGFGKGLESGIDRGINQGTQNILCIMDYIYDHPEKSDSDISEALSCDLELVQETRKRLNR